MAKDKTQNIKDYKTSPIGMIPKDWDVDYIENLAIIKTGKKDTQNKVENGAYPFYVRSQTIEKINSFSYDGVAVLTAGDGVGVGKVFHYCNGKFDFHQRVYKISDFKSNIDSKYFFEYFKQNFIREVTKATAKTSVDSVRLDMIAKMFIPLPPIAEQRKIAQLFSVWSESIETLENLIVRKERNKRALMSQLLTGKKRFKKFIKTKGEKKSVIGKIPSDWDSVSIGDLTKHHKQGYYTQEEYNSNSKYYLLRGTDMLNTHIDLSTTPKINSTPKDYEMFKAEVGDFLIVRSGAIGRYGIVTNEPPSIFGSYLIKFQFKPELINDFFGYIYESPVALNQLRGITQGSTNININAENIKTLIIPLPSTSEQKAIVNCLKNCDEEILTLKTQLEHCKQQKKGLMQVLLTGKKRVKI